MVEEGTNDEEGETAAEEVEREEVEKEEEKTEEEIVSLRSRLVEVVDVSYFDEVVEDFEVEQVVDRVVEVMEAGRPRSRRRKQNKASLWRSRLSRLDDQVLRW